jgi:hypothetical protein
MLTAQRTSSVSREVLEIRETFKPLNAQPALIFAFPGFPTTAELVRLVQKLHHRGQRPVVVRQLAEEFLQEKQLAGGLR